MAIYLTPHWDQLCSGCRHQWAKSPSITAISQTGELGPTSHAACRNLPLSLCFPAAQKAKRMSSLLPSLPPAPEVAPKPDKENTPQN